MTSKTVRNVRSILNSHSELDAVRYLRSLGVSFKPAKTYVREIAENKPWWRHYR